LLKVKITGGNRLAFEGEVVQEQTGRGRGVPPGFVSGNGEFHCIRPEGKSSGGLRSLGYGVGPKSARQA